MIGGKVVTSIEICSFDKFNPRTDRKNYIWFRFENSFYSDHRIFSLSGDQQRLFIFLICEASKKNSATIEACSALAAAMLRLPEEQIINDLNALHDVGLVVAIANQKPANGRRKAGSKPSNGIATEHNNTIHTDRQVFDFQKIYKDYPRKLGKSDGLKKCDRDIKTPEDYDALQSAVARFKAYHEKKGSSPEYIPHFSTFMSTWRDWLEDETGTSSLRAPEEVARPFVDHAALWADEDPLLKPDFVRQLEAQRD